MMAADRAERMNETGTRTMADREQQQRNKADEQAIVDDMIAAREQILKRTSKRRESPTIRERLELGFEGDTR